jgi:hypothetical protein
MPMEKSKDYLAALASIKAGDLNQAAAYMFEEHYKDKMTPQQEQQKIISIVDTLKAVFRERYIALREGEFLSDGEAEDVLNEVREALGFDNDD